MTAQQLVERAQRAAMPQEDISPYEGEWVALRDGRVVASDKEPVKLKADPAVSDDDVLMPVPRDRGSILIA